jgi:predicted RNA-binding protein with PUA-like domain
MKRFWLFKSDIEDYPLTQFIKDKITAWEGVRNYQARNFMMKDMQVGDLGIFYHSNAEPSAAVAALEVSALASPDKLQFEKKSDYFDEKATREKPRWYCVEVRYRESFKSLVSLEAIRSEKDLQSMQLLQKGNRLSILPLTEKEYKKILKMGGV